MPKRFCQCRGCTACKKPPNSATACGTLYDLDTTATLKCPPCQAAATTARQARPSSSSRGLGWAFTRRKQNDQAYQQATHCRCPGCPQHAGHCELPFTRQNPKTAGHTHPRSRGGSSSPIIAVCRKCNSADGGRLAHNRK